MTYFLNTITSVLSGAAICEKFPVSSDEISGSIEALMINKALSSTDLNLAVDERFV